MPWFRQQPVAYVKQAVAASDHRHLSLHCASTTRMRMIEALQLARLFHYPYLVQHDEEALLAGMGRVVIVGGHCSTSTGSCQWYPSALGAAMHLLHSEQRGSSLPHLETQPAGHPSRQGSPAQPGS